MPLAIELAAARARTIGIAEIERRLDARFRLLRGSRRDADPRHQALDDTVRWSFDLLGAEEKSFFAELCVFAGQFDVGAAAFVCADRDVLDALDLVSNLADKSMLIVHGAPSGVSRFDMLETLKAYGRDRLDATELRRLEARHARYHAQLARSIGSRLGTSEEPDAMRDADIAFADLRAAHHFLGIEGDVETECALVSEIGEYAMRAMRYEVLGWAAATVVKGVPDHPLASTVKGLAAYGAWIRGEFESALALAAAIEREELDGRENARGLAQRVQANVLYAQGEIRAGLEANRRQIRLAEDIDDVGGIVRASYMLSIALSSIGELEEARFLAGRARDLGEETGNATNRASAWAAFAFAAHDDVPAAQAAFSECDRIARSVGNRWMSAFARTELSGLLLLQGDSAKALSGLADVVDIWFRAGEWSQQWHTLTRCVVALAEIGETSLAAEVVGAIERRATMATPPVISAMRERVLNTVDGLRSSLGENYLHHHKVGAETRIADIVHRTRMALRAAV